jgi:Zn-dependent protease
VILVSLAAFICIVTAITLRPIVAGSGSLGVSGFNGVSVLIAFAVFVGAAATLGLSFGLPLIAALLLHELGHVLAYRMLGHENARFRLVPLLGNTKISDRPLKTDGEEFFVAIMGPAFGLAPLVLAMTLSVMLGSTMPEVSRALWIFAVTSGAVNFISLLPFWPFNGARCTRAAVANFWPALAPAMTVFMSTAFATASLRTGSVALMVMAGVGAQSLFRKPRHDRVSMSADTGLIALSAYSFTMAAHFTAGWMLFSAYF